MADPNKILTVSYGTFACTLEGFEDPFGMMQQVAQYFRGLSAEDRYFGGEPLQPDPSEIRQIAAQAATQPITSELTSDGMTLRPGGGGGGTAIFVKHSDEDAPQNAPLKGEEVFFSSRRSTDSSGEDAIDQSDEQANATLDAAPVDRLFEAADSKLQAPDQKRRTSALERLKRAVMATEQERREQRETDATSNSSVAIGTDKVEGELDDVRDPFEPTKSSTEDNNTLILGADQRVSDTPEFVRSNSVKKKPEPTGLRVASRIEDPVPAGHDLSSALPAEESFEDFSKRNKLTTLAELVEASAAYITLIEGRPRFSRRQLFAKITSDVYDKELTPDQLLKTFWELLHSGAILRVQDGQFALSRGSKTSFQEKLAV